MDASWLAREVGALKPGKSLILALTGNADFPEITPPRFRIRRWSDVPAEELTSRFCDNMTSEQLIQGLVRVGMTLCINPKRACVVHEAGVQEPLAVVDVDPTYDPALIVSGVTGETLEVAQQATAKTVARLNSSPISPLVNNRN